MSKKMTLNETKDRLVEMMGHLNEDYNPNERKEWVSAVEPGKYYRHPMLGYVVKVIDVAGNGRTFSGEVVENDYPEDARHLPVGKRTGFNTPTDMQWLELPDFQEASPEGEISL